MPWHEGDVVHKLRRLAKLTVEGLAVRADLSSSIIRRLEKGITKNADRDSIAKLARVFGLSTGELIDLVPHGAVPMPTIDALDFDAEAKTIERAARERRRHRR